MININSHGHGIYPVLIILFHFLFTKLWGISGTPSISKQCKTGVGKTYNTPITIECNFANTHKVTDSAEAVMMMIMMQTRASKCVDNQLYKVSTGCCNSVSWQQILRSWSSKTWCHTAKKCAAFAVILEVETRICRNTGTCPSITWRHISGNCNLSLEIYKQNLRAKCFMYLASSI